MTIKTKSKIIFLDFGVFMFRAIFAWKNNRQVSPTYTCLNMIIANLRRIGISPEDRIFVAVDGRKSWRKSIDPEYKANRKDARDSHSDIDWEDTFAKFDDLLLNLDIGTNWQIMKKEHLEADDWMSAGSRYFKDNEVILVTFDQDMEQLTTYPNVKIFSPLIKFKGGKGAYKIVKDPYKTLAKKIEKETSDNLISPLLTEEDYEKRKMIVSLLELPSGIEEIIVERFKNTKEKIGDSSFIWNDNLRGKIENLYTDRTKLVTYADCLLKEEKKKKLKKRKK